MTDADMQATSVDERIAQVAFNADGLAPVIVQQWDTHEVLMLGVGRCGGTPPHAHVRASHVLVALASGVLAQGRHVRSHPGRA